MYGWGADPNVVSGYVCRSCGCNGPWDPVVVLTVAEYERLRGIEARLKDDAIPLDMVVAFSHFGRAGAGMALAAYRKAVLREVKP